MGPTFEASSLEQAIKDEMKLAEKEGCHFSRKDFDFARRGFAAKAGSKFGERHGPSTLSALEPQDQHWECLISGLIAAILLILVLIGRRNFTSFSSLQGLQECQEPFMQMWRPQDLSFV